MLFRYIFLFSFILFSAGITRGQDTLTFAKGRTMTSLYGTLLNQNINLSTGEKINTTGYSIGTKSGLFLMNNWVNGINFSFSRSEYANSNIDLSSENFLLGLWSRLYFAENGAAALYAELTPFYTGVYQNSQIIDDTGSIISIEELSGNGFGIAPGIGFTYIISRNVGFGMTLSYSWARLNVNNTDLITGSRIPEVYDVNQLQFSFNFQIYLDQFFF